MDTNLLPAFLFPLPLPWCAPRPCLPRRRPGEVPSAHTGQKGQAPGRGLQPITSSLFTLTSYFYLAPPQGEPRKKHHRKPLRLCDSPPLSPLRGQLPLQGGSSKKVPGSRPAGVPRGAAPPGNSPGGRIELESCGAGHKVNCPAGARESPLGGAPAQHTTACGRGGRNRLRRAKARGDLKRGPAPSLRIKAMPAASHPHPLPAEWRRRRGWCGRGSGSGS